MAWVPKGERAAVLAFYVLGKFNAQVSGNVLWLYTAELYPTNLRSQAVGTCSMISMWAQFFLKFLLLLLVLKLIFKLLPRYLQHFSVPVLLMHGANYANFLQVHAATTTISLFQDLRHDLLLPPRAVLRLAPSPHAIARRPRPALSPRGDGPAGDEREAAAADAGGGANNRNRGEGILKLFGYLSVYVFISGKNCERTCRWAWG